MRSRHDRLPFTTSAIRRLLRTGLIHRHLLNGAANLGKYIVGVGPDEADRAHDDYQNHSQHHCVFRNVLSTFIVPELL